MPKKKSILTPILSLPIGHTAAVCSAKFSPSGKYLLTLSRDETIVLWDNLGRQLHTYQLLHDSVVIFFGFSPDESAFITFEGLELLLTIRDLAGTSVTFFNSNNPYESIRSFLRTGKLLGVELFTGPFREKPSTGRIPTAPLGQKFIFSEDFSQFLTTRLIKGRSAIRSSQPTLVTTDGKSREFVIDDKYHFENSVNFAAIERVNYILTCGRNIARVWDFGGQEILQLAVPGGRFNRITGVVYAAKIDSFIAVCSKEIIFFFDRKGEITREVPSGLGQLNAIELSKEGDQFIVCGSAGIKMFDLEGKSVKSLGGGSSKVEYVEFSSDGRHLLTYDKYRQKQIITIWNPRRNRNDSYFSLGRDLRLTRFSPDGKYVEALYRDYTLAKWSNKDETEELKTLDGEILDQADFAAGSGQIFTLDGGADSDKWVARVFDKNLETENRFSGKLIRGGQKYAKTDIACSSDGKYFVVKGPYFLACFDERGKRLFSVDGSITKFNTDYKPDKPRDTWSGRGTIQFSPDNKYLIAASYDDFLLKYGSRKQYAPLRYREIFVFDLNGKVVLKFDGQKVWTYSFSPDGNYIFLGYIEGEIEKYDLQKNKVSTFQGHSAAILSINFSPNQNLLISGSADYTAKVWNVDTGKELATLIQFDIDSEDPEALSGKEKTSVKIQTEWVVTSPSGLFDASPGAMKELFYVYGTEIIELDQLKERYYEPGLLAKSLGIIPGDFREVSGFEKLDLYPELIQSDIKANQLKLKLKKRSGGIGKISLFINNKEVLEDADPSRSKSVSIDLNPFIKFFFQGPNEIAIRLYNEEGWLKSAANKLIYHFNQSKALGSLLPETGEEIDFPDPTLYAIIIGTSNYYRDELKLTYPDQDAALLSNAIELVGKKLFGKRVNITLLSTDPETANHPASKNNIEKAFEEVSEKALANDILIVYFSGHGSNYGDGDKAKFYYITKDIRSGRLSDPVIRKQGTVSSNELTTWINAIPAKKQVLIFDTCHSGKVVDSLVEGKMVDSTQERAIERMKDRTGMFVLAGSSADKVSYEASRYGHGLLTYSLLWGIKGEALKADDVATPVVDVMQLFQYSRDKVPKLAAEIGQEQEPVLSFPHGGDSFAVGIADDESRSKILLAQPRTVVVQTIFLFNEDFYDHLNLSEAVDDHLIEVVSTQKDVKIVFVNLPKFPGAWTMRGLYSKVGDQYRLVVNIFSDGKVLSGFSVTGKDTQDLVPKVTRNLFSQIK